MEVAPRSVPVGLSGFAVSPTGVLLRPADDVPARSAVALAHGETWVVADPGAATTHDTWLSRVDPRLALLLVVDADRSGPMRRRVERAAAAKGGPVDGVLVRDAGPVSQERAWPGVAELVTEGTLRCAGLVTTRPTVVERCMAWHRVDAVLLAGETASAASVLFDVCRWSGVTVLVAAESSVHVG